MMFAFYLFFRTKKATALLSSFKSPSTLLMIFQPLGTYAEKSAAQAGRAMQDKNINMLRFIAIPDDGKFNSPQRRLGSRTKPNAETY